MSILKNKKCIGWDIGSSGIRAVELEQKDGRVQLKNFAYLNFNKNIDVTFNDKDSFNIVSEAILKIVHNAKFSTPNSFAVVPGYYSYNKVFKFSNKYSSEKIDKWLNSNISHNAFSDGDILLDWQLIFKKNGTQKVYASAVSKELIDKYQIIFKQAELKLNGLETSYHSLIRSIFGNDKTKAVIIDVGSKFSDLTIVKDNIPYISKSIMFGGEDISNDISTNLNISFDQADQIKKDALVVNKKIIEKLKLEINKMLDNFRFEHDKIKPDKIILTGGELKNHENCKLFKKYFNIDTYLANPWGRVLYHQDLKNHLDKISPNFAVAVGSAMKIL